MRRKLFLVGGLAGLVTFLDQALKAWVQHAFRLYESRPVIEGFFHLTYVRNPGAAFGLFVGQGPVFRQVFFVGITAVALVAIGVAVARLDARRRWTLGALGLVAGGAVGNLIDRVRLGEVVDFLDVFWRQYHWPAFNLADSAITAGVAMLLLEEWFAHRKGRNPPAG